MTVFYNHLTTSCFFALSPFRSVGLRDCSDRIENVREISASPPPNGTPAGVEAR